MKKEEVEVMRVRKPTELEYDYISRQEYFRRIEEGQEFSESFSLGWFDFTNWPKSQEDRFCFMIGTREE